MLICSLKRCRQIYCQVKDIKSIFFNYKHINSSRIIISSSSSGSSSSNSSSSSSSSNSRIFFFICFKFGAIKSPQPLVKKLEIQSTPADCISSFFIRIYSKHMSNILTVYFYVNRLNNWLANRVASTKRVCKTIFHLKCRRKIFSISIRKIPQ